MVVAREVADPRPPMAPLVGTLRAGVGAATPAEAAGAGDPAATERVPALAVVTPRFELAGVGHVDDPGTVGLGLRAAPARDVPVGSPSASDSTAASPGRPVWGAMGDAPPGQSVAAWQRAGWAEPAEPAMPLQRDEGADARTSPRGVAGLPGEPSGMPAGLASVLFPAPARAGGAIGAVPARPAQRTAVSLAPPGTPGVRSGIGREAAGARSAPRSAGSGHAPLIQAATGQAVAAWMSASRRPAAPVAVPDGERPRSAQRATGGGVGSANHAVTSHAAEPGIAGLDGLAESFAGPAVVAAQRAGETTATATATEGRGAVTGGGPSDRELDALAGRIYERIRRRFRSELLVDRERSGALVEFGR
jgi:hypothetical protein